MKRLFVINSIILLLSLSCTAEQPDSKSNNFIDLTAITWYAKKGFKQGDAGKIAKIHRSDLKNYKKIDQFPIILNQIFKPDKPDQLLHYTLFTEFQIPPEQMATNKSIYLAWIGENWEVYLNGVSIKRDIHIKNSKMQKNRSFRGIKISLPGSIIQSGKNTLIFHIIGYSSPITAFTNTNTGFLYESPYIIASDEYISNEFNEYSKIAINTIYLFFGLYHLFFFYRRRQNSYNFYFAFFALFLAIDGFTKTSLIHHYFSDSDIIFTIKYSSQSILVLFFMLFIKNYFYSNEKFKLIEKFIIVWSIVLFLSFVFSTPIYNEILLNIFHITVIPILFYGIYYIFLAVYKKLNDSIAMALSILILVFTATWDIIDEHVFRTGIGLLKYGFSAYVVAIIVILANRFLHVHNESERLNIELGKQKDAFFRFVPTEFIRLLGKQSGVDISLGDSSLKEMSVLFSDIHSFTQISEKMSPNENFQFLNGYLKYVLPALEENEGIVDKYMGDGILALFPKKDEKITSSDKAVQSAVSMQKYLDDYNASFSGPDISIGIGIHTGSLMLGTVGSAKRIDTTVIGDTVNLASRLESLNSYFKTDILVSEKVINELTEGFNYKFREIAKVIVKGKSLPVSVYEIYSHKSNGIIETIDETKDQFDKAIELYRKREFKKALEVFSLILKKNKYDLVSKMYIKQSQSLMNENLDDDWNGIERLETK